MKVLLVRPPYNRLKGYHPEPYFPLGIGYIGSVLEAQGHDVKIWNVDATPGMLAGVMPDEFTMLKERQQRFEAYISALRNDNHIVWGEVRGVLDDFDPDVIGVSVLTPEVGSAVKLSSLAKEGRKDRVVIWGGHHATFLPEDVLNYGVVDVVARGEGENIAPDLFSAISSEKNRLDEVKGISYRNNGSVFHNPDKELIEDLNSIPFPAHHLSLFPEIYTRMERIGMMTNRGCPFKCGYCSSPAFTRKNVRYRDFENIISEIKYVTKFYNKNIVSFLDDNFTINKKLVVSFCENLIKADLKVSWDTMTRADILTEDVVQLLKDAGCVGLTIGIESGSERVLKQIDKGVELDKVIGAYELLYKYDIPSGANFIAGFPKETMEDIEKTFEVMKKIKTVNINFNIFEPIPGSPLLDYYEDENIISKNIDWRTYGFWPMNHFATSVTPQEFKEKMYEIVEWVFKYKISFKVRWMKIKPYIKNDPLYPFKKVLKSVKNRILKRFVKGV